MRKFLKNKRVLADCHIYSMLSSHAKKRHFSFHTPGHKEGAWDVTELSYSDNLSCPHGCIAAAQRDIARILGAHSSFIITDGSTAGVLSMLFAAKSLGVKRLAVCENTHKSAFNGCAALGIEPVVFQKKETGGIPLPVTIADLCQAEEADGVLITSPDYYGNVPDLAAIHAYCKERGKLLLIDGAHGGHLHYDKPLYAGTYADMWVDGVHKSLPAFTQGAVVSAKDAIVAEALFRAVDIFRTTSPSYPIMASVEYAVKYPKNERLERAVTAFMQTSERIYPSKDWTKLCVRFGENARRAHEELQREGIYAEFCDGDTIVFYLSPATKEKHFARLKKRLSQLFEEFPYVPVQQIHTPTFLRTEGAREWVELSKATGRICAQACGFFPPCTPLIQVGERIDAEKLARLKNADNAYGLKENKISVFKPEEKE